jgi:hypothetical protein
MRSSTPQAHRFWDEFPAGYSSTGCSPALPASASPAGVEHASGAAQVRGIWRPKRKTHTNDFGLTSDSHIEGAVYDRPLSLNQQNTCGHRPHLQLHTDEFKRLGNYETLH